ncbi:MAG TPA: DUF3352 domain-containing protein [Solirubrobacteraceae bacterium]|nr:DUF3352 domain-containing protein [Solirubrobacteraceae bacterium]
MNLHTINVLRLPSSLPPRGHHLPVAFAALVLAAPLAGCGSSSSPPLDPATVVPSSAPLYIGAVVQPSGSLKRNTDTAARKLTHSGEPFSGLLSLLSPSGHKLDYGHDVKPWLGSRAGAFLASVQTTKAAEALSEGISKGFSEVLSGTSLAGLSESALQTLLHSQGVQGAIVLDTTDVGKARAFLEARAGEAGAHAANYRGVSYQVAANSNAEGIVGKFAVIGSEAALRGVIETEQSGAASSIVHAAGYAKLVASAEAGALANVYLDAHGLLGASATKSPAASSALPLLRGAVAGTEQAYVSLLPSATSIALDIDTLASAQATNTGLVPNQGAAQVLSGLPGGSWLAFGIGDVGASFGEGAAGLRALAALGAKIKIGSFSLEGVFAPFSSPSIDLNRDILSWTGGAGLFVSGNGLLNLQAGLVIASKDPVRSRAAVGKLAQAYRLAGDQATPTTIAGAEEAVTVRIKGFPVVVAIGAGQGKFAIGLGPASVQEALNPSTTLSSAANYQAAATTLGHGSKPSLLVEFPTLVSLIETLGLGQSEGISTALPYLQSLGTLTAGGGEPLGNGITRARVVLGLQ